MAERPVFQSVYQAEVSYVWESLRRLGVHPADIEDLAHDVFVTAYDRLDDYDPSRPIRPWLFGIAYRVALDHRRSARVRREVIEEVPESAHDGPTPAEMLAALEDRQM